MPSRDAEEELQRWECMPARIRACQTQGGTDLTAIAAEEVATADSSCRGLPSARLQAARQEDSDMSQGCSTGF